VSELEKAPDKSRGHSSVEIYRSIHGKYTWRIIAVADKNTEQALRDAKALALALEDEIFADLAARYKQRRSPQA